MQTYQGFIINYNMKILILIKHSDFKVTIRISEFVCLKQI